MSTKTNNIGYVDINNQQYIRARLREGIDRQHVYYLYSVEEQCWYFQSADKVGEPVRGLKVGRLNYRASREMHPKFKTHFVTVYEKMQEKKQLLLDQAEKETKKKSSKEEPFKWKIAKI